jgi:hypothetical protein
VRLLRWLAARNRLQIVCFTLGALLVIDALANAADDRDSPELIVGAIVVAIGVALKAIDALRARDP